MVAKLALDIRERFVAPAVLLEVPLQPLQRYAEDIAVMEPCAEHAIAQTQPQAVQALDVLRPQPRRMGSEIRKK